jgi:hypothetical protein
VSRPGNRRAARLSAIIASTLAALTGIGLIGFSPLALGSFRGATDRWERLSFIGQTYPPKAKANHHALLSKLAWAMAGAGVTAVLLRLFHGRPRRN